MAYSIEAAIASDLFDEVMVSTDDAEIAEIAIRYGAKVPFLRSAENADDFATTFDVVREVVLKYESRNKKIDYTCCLYPCAPFVSADMLKAAFALLQREHFDSVLPVIPFGFPIQRAFKIDERNKTAFFYPEFSLTRSQDLERGYHDAGQFYWMDTDACLKKQAIITDNTGSIVMSELEAQDIDTELDWKLAELKHQLLASGNNV